MSGGVSEGSLRVAAIQAEAVPGRLATNVATAVRLARSAVAAGARLIVLPEAFPTGYDPDVFRGPLPTLDACDWLTPLRELADASGAVVIVNCPIDRGTYRTLSDLVLSPGEPVVAAYDKQHLFGPEGEIFTPGPAGTTVNIGGHRVALSICHDASFPEHAAAAAGTGASVYVNSGAYFPGGERRRDIQMAARALDNSIHVVFSGLVGAPSGFIGGSAIYDPSGRAITRLGTEEGVVVAEVSHVR